MPYILLIVCFQTITGDTLTTNLSAANSAKKAATKKAQKITQDSEQTEIESSSPVLAGLLIPDPVFFCSIEIESLAYQKQLDEALACLTKEDPSIKVHVDEDTGQTVLSGILQNTFNMGTVGRKYSRTVMECFNYS